MVMLLPAGRKSFRARPPDRAFLHIFDRDSGQRIARGLRGRVRIGDTMVSRTTGGKIC
jgi:hypothetical protein